MDILELPLVTTQHSLREAIEAMKGSNRRAVVLWITDQEQYLCTNREVAEAWGMGFRQCSELVSKIRQESSMAPLVDLWGVQKETLASRLDSLGSSFGVLNPGGSATAAAVVTRHEHLGDPFRNGAKVCMCTGPLNHQAEELPPVSNGGPCRDCTVGIYECF
jgi:hypothetical protein